MRSYFSSRMKLAIACIALIALFGISATPNSAAAIYSSALRRYPYLTDVVGSYATINSATDRSESSGSVRFGRVGSEACTAQAVIPTKTPISVNGVLQYQ